jgi:Domain of unknown function (DUF4266)
MLLPPALERHWAKLAGVWAAALILLALSLMVGGCATVRPEQRAILADPVMQFESEPGEQAARQHVLENREGAMGGGSIKGGGCGCN